jgi:two-component system CheB/CheR fusion protein
VPDLEHLLHDVIDTLTTKEHEVQDKCGHWYLLQLRPYETADNKIAGLVMVLFDIDASKRFTQLATDAGNYANAIVQTVREPLLILDGKLRVKTATRGFYNRFRVSPKDTEGKLFHKLGQGQWNIPKLRELLEKILPKNSSVHDFEVEHVFPRIGRKKMLLNAHRVQMAGMNEHLILLSIEEVKK